MFGYIRPLQDELKIKEYRLYRSVYCGLCHALGGCAGCLASLTLNYDFVFLAMVRAGLCGDEINIGQRRCIVHPFKKQPHAVFDSLNYAAAASLISVKHKFDDDRADRDLGIKALLYPQAVHLKNRAMNNPELKDTLVRLDESAEKACTELREAEKHDPSPDEAAEYSGELTKALLSSGLEGTKARIAEELGRHIGRWVYFADAADDYEKDIKKGRFNPFRNEESLPKDRIRTSMLLELNAAAKALELIDFEDKGIETVVKNILYLGMPSAAEKILDKDKDPNVSHI